MLIIVIAGIVIYFLMKDDDGSGSESNPTPSLSLQVYEYPRLLDF